ncbi:hypothetical protein HDV57DRAFT_496528 [Trichoderma longibrachiatum]
MGLTCPAPLLHLLEHILAHFACCRVLSNKLLLLSLTVQSPAASATQPRKVIVDNRRRELAVQFFTTGSLKEQTIVLEATSKWETAHDNAG